MKKTNFENLVGKTLNAASFIVSDGYKIGVRFMTTDGKIFELLQSDIPEEHTLIESHYGELSNLLGSPITYSGERKIYDDDFPVDDDEDNEPVVLYKFSTKIGFVEIFFLADNFGGTSANLYLYETR